MGFFFVLYLPLGWENCPSEWCWQFRLTQPISGQTPSPPHLLVCVRQSLLSVKGPYPKFRQLCPFPRKHIRQCPSSFKIIHRPIVLFAQVFLVHTCSDTEFACAEFFLPPPCTKVSIFHSRSGPGALHSGGYILEWLYANHLVSKDHMLVVSKGALKTIQLKLNYLRFLSLPCAQTCRPIHP